MKRWIVILMLGIYLCGCEKKSEPINDEVSEEHQRLLIMDEVNREDYESNRFYAMGDPVVFLSGDQNEVLWQVTLTDYEVIQDSHEGFKKALVLHFNYRYFMPEFIMSQTLQSVVHPTVFYQDIALKPQSLAEATIAYNIGNYAKSPHILYEPIVNDENSLAGRAYRNVAHRIMGEEVPFLNLEEETSFMTKVKKFFSHLVGKEK